MLFAIPHAARRINCFRVGSDGRTAEELRTGPWKKVMCTFGEKVLGYPTKVGTKKRDMEAKAIPGLYVGHTARTASALLLTEGGVRKVRGVSRLTETERWDYKLKDFLTGTPWDYTEQDDTEVAITAAPLPGLVPAPSAERAFYVKRENIERWGAYPGCPACVQILRGQKASVSHTDACRERIKVELQKEGSLRREQACKERGAA
eukprot:3761761-Amphidinium_carterae.1